MKWLENRLFFYGHESFWPDLPVFFLFLIRRGVLDVYVHRACLCILVNGEMRLKM